VYASAEGWILIDFSHASMADALFSFQVSMPLTFHRVKKWKTYSYDIHRPIHQSRAN
jgi:hypothetical protein